MFERFGNGRNTEIIINDELLKMLIELQNQFTNCLLYTSDAADEL